MSALPSVQSLVSADTTARALPPAPAVSVDASHSFAATLERQVERQRSAAADRADAKPADASDASQPTSTGTSDKTAKDKDKADAATGQDATGQDVVKTPTDQVPSDAQTAAAQAALAASLTQADIPVATPAVPSVPTITAPIQAATTTPTVAAELQAPIPTATDANAPVAGTASSAPVAVPDQAAPTVADALAAPVAAAPDAAVATGPALPVAPQQKAAAAPAAQLQATTTPATDAGTAAETAVPAVIGAATQAGGTPVVKKNAAAKVPDAPVSTAPPADALLNPAIEDAAANAVAAPVAKAPVIADPTNAQDAPGQTKNTTVPLTPPTTTTTAMQSVAQQLHAEKQALAKSTKDEPLQTVATDKTFAETMTATTGATATATRTLTAEAPTTAPQAPVPANPMDKAVAQQVSRTLVQNLPNGEKMMVVRLTPPELGTVRVEVVEHQGVLSARLHADDDGVRQALEKALPLMRQELRASDAPIRDVQVGDQSRFDQSNPNQQGQGDAQGRNGGRARREDEPAFSLDGITAPRETLRPSASQGLGGRVDRSGVNALA